MPTSTHSVTGVILAGGQARRMGGLDKGLIAYQGRPLVEYAVQALVPQVDSLLINANRHIESYQALGYPVVQDTLHGFYGPLAGMLSAMQHVSEGYILTAPCDCPTPPRNLRQRMMETLLIEQADIAIAHDGDYLQPVFCLLPCHLQTALETYLQQGGRKIDHWLQQYRLAVVDFSDQAACFINFNSPDDLAAAEHRIASPVPLLGFAAFSGTGKTTLLRQLIPALTAKKLRVAVIKHAHHAFDIDIPGKDSYEIRHAGARQVLVASSRLMALMEVHSGKPTEPSLAALIPRLDCRHIDIILVEGFKHEAIAKIELHRPSLNTPLLYPQDRHIIALASDQPLAVPDHIRALDLNEVDIIADFIESFIQNWTA